MDRATASRRFGPCKVELFRFVELVAVTGLIVAQPLFDLLGKNPRLLIAWEATTASALLLVVAIVVLPATMTWVLEIVLALLLPRDRVHAAMVGAWVAVLVVVLAHRATSLAVGLLLAASVAAGVVAAWLVVRFSVARSWLRVLAVAPVGFALVFVAWSPATPVIFAGNPEPRAVNIAKPSRVVMIVLDELPLESLLDGGGSIDAARFPNFAALAGTSTWYRNSTTVAPFTEAAVPAIVTGQLPRDADAVPAATAHPDNLFTLLGAAYRLNVHESVTRLCPRAMCPPARRLAGIHPGFGGMVGDVANIWRDFADLSRSDDAFAAGIGGEDFHALRAGDAFVRSLRASREPTLDFLHLLLPHFPWHYTPSGQDYAAFPPVPHGLSGSDWVSSDTAAISRQRHLLQLAATDQLLGEVLNRLRAIDVLDESLVVVTADHGVAFRAGLPFRGVSRATYPSIMWTPLFIKYPGQQQAGVDDRAAESVDVLPTIMRALGVPDAGDLDGRPLQGPPRKDGPRPLFDWSSSVVHPQRGHYVFFDGPRGFRRVLQTVGVGGAPDDALRLYRLGPYGALVGADAYALAVPGPPVAAATLAAPLRYQTVDTDAEDVPWASIQGDIAIGVGRSVAVSANGVIAGVFTTVGPPHGGRTSYYGMLAPVLRDGTNLMQLFLIDGPPDQPVLRPVTIEAASPGK